MTIKSWFLNKNFNQQQRYIIETAQMGGELEIVKETEKAYFFKIESEFGAFTFWCPKSCIEEKTVVVSPEIITKAEVNNNNYEEKFVKGAKVKYLGGRKIFTVESEHISYGSVWLNNGKRKRISELEIVENI